MHFTSFTSLALMKVMEWTGSTAWMEEDEAAVEGEVAGESVTEGVGDSSVLVSPSRASSVEAAC